LIGNIVHNLGPALRAVGLIRTVHNPIVNAFSVDVEGFVESNLQSFYIPDKYINHTKEKHEIEENTTALLQILDEAKVKGTFFFIGRLARDVPALVKKTAQAGHEIGCHSYLHLRIFDIDKNEFSKKLAAAKKDLEDVSGQQVCGFRAPDFSMTQESMWALDILKELGFVYDSSIYPFGLHDVYGIKDAVSSIHRLPNGLIEFPLSTAKLLGRSIPFAGGGYFRLYPLTLTKILLRKLNKQGHPAMFYIHPYEVGSVVPWIPGLSAYRKFRHYYNCKNGKSRLGKLLNSFKFAPAIEVLQHHYYLGDH
jgi:polysaccharide deacetylase family protein (PEP-CTERM system associated)